MQLIFLLSLQSHPTPLHSFFSVVRISSRHFHPWHPYNAEEAWAFLNVYIPLAERYVVSLCSVSCGLPRLPAQYLPSQAGQNHAMVTTLPFPLFSYLNLIMCVCVPYCFMTPRCTAGNLLPHMTDPGRP